MNKMLRKELKESLGHIEDAQGIIEGVKDCEQESFDNLPEGIQASERGEKFEENVNELDEIYDEMRELCDRIEELMN